MTQKAPSYGWIGFLLVMRSWGSWIWRKFRALPEKGLYLLRPWFWIRVLLVVFLPVADLLDWLRTKGGQPEDAETNVSWVQSLNDSVLLGIWTLVWFVAGVVIAGSTLVLIVIVVCHGIKVSCLT